MQSKIKLINTNYFLRWTSRPLFKPGSVLALVMLFAGLLIIGCAGRFGHGGGDGPEQGPSSGRQASPIEHPLQMTLPRKFRYADLEFTVTKGVISIPPASGQLNNAATAVIILSVVNPRKDDLHIRDGLWQLRLGDGTVYKQIYSENIGPRETKEVKASFQVPMNAQWGGAQLTLDEKGKEPATVALEGEVDKPTFPVQLATGATAATKDPGATYTIDSASLDLDGMGTRAELGKQYLNLIVRVVDKEPGSAGQFLPEFFRLLVNGEPFTPETTGDKTTVTPGGTENFAMSYVIPAGAVSVELEVGKPDIQTTAKIPIDLHVAGQ